MWTVEADAITDLRTLLSDGPTDKFASRKKVFGGKQDGSNKNFKTFERRRVTNLKTTTDPNLGVFVNGAKVSLTADYPDTGDLALTAAPAVTDEVVGNYYYQWWIDSEFSLFLKNATQWIGLGTDVTKVPDGLQPAALHYAGQEAYDKLCLWWSIRMSETYRLEDAPGKAVQAVLESFQKQAERFQKKANELRKQYYSRQDQAEAPLFRSIGGRVRDSVPKR